MIARVDTVKLCEGVSESNCVVTMAESKGVMVTPLNGSNYPTWKIQCRMALMKDGLWSIANGSERPPDAAEIEKYAKFVTRRDRALATIVLSVDPSFLYLIGDPEGPIVVWGKLADQFQKKTWAAKLELRRKLHSLRLKDGDSVQDHVRAITEIFDGLSVAGDAVSEEDRVVHLLASLPDSYNMLVTALEANAEVPKMEVVTERLLHEEWKLKNREDAAGADSESAMFAGPRSRRKGPKCYHCGKFGHIKRNCRELARENKFDSSYQQDKEKANNADVRRRRRSCSAESERESIGLIARHALSACAGRSDSWIVDSGATCHMCNNLRQFVKMQNLEKPLEVALGDGHELEAIGRGDVVLDTKLPSGRVKKCTLNNVLYVPKLPTICSVCQK